MARKSNTPDNVQRRRLQQPAVMPSRLSVGFSCVKVDNTGELYYVLKWAEHKGRRPMEFFWGVRKFPFFVFFPTSHKGLGWNDVADRAVKEISFADFLGICDWA